MRIVWKATMLQAATPKLPMRRSARACRIAM